MFLCQTVHLLYSTTYEKDKVIYKVCKSETQLQNRLQAPELSPGNVMSILVSASFLKMNGLVDAALAYAHDNMNKVLAVTHNFNCLGEPLLLK